MSILSNLKTNFVAPFAPSTCPSQRRQFHHVSSPLQNIIENNAVSENISCRQFTIPNLLNQNTHEEKYPSNYKNINHFEVRPNGEIENSLNSSEMIAEVDNTDGFPKLNCSTSSRKRPRKSMNPCKIPDKHNSNRQILNEMMDIDFSNNSPNMSLTVDTEDQELENNDLGCFNLSDLLVLPDCSSPVCVSRIDIAIGSTIPSQTTCLEFPICSPKFRQRQISITESEDSFIVFESGTDGECEFSDDVESEDDESSELEENQESDADSPGSVVPTKKVRFADDKELCEIHPMIKWSFAYQAARKGPWEMYARDRGRFKNRISLVEEKIAHCFEPEHRQKVYNQRFREKMVE